MQDDEVPDVHVLLVHEITKENFLVASRIVNRVYMTHCEHNNVVLVNNAQERERERNFGRQSRLQYSWQLPASSPQMP
jgi:hypothetical protein